MIFSSIKVPAAGVKNNPLVMAVLAVACAVWILLFALALFGYSGSKAYYVLLSIVTSVMLLDGLRQKVSYGYLFMTSFLWLGLWFKLTVHTILNYPFIEPVGNFLGEAAAWDEVLWVASLTCLGVMLGRIIFERVRRQRPQEVAPCLVPHWYESHRKMTWAALSLLAATVIFVNMHYGIHLIGLAPRTSLMWPLNSVIAWLLNIGLATGVGTLLWWDLALKKNATLSLYAVIAEGLVTSVSIMSRAAYVFHVIPQLLVAYHSRRTLVRWSGAKTFFLGLTMVLFLVVSISAVTTFRNYLYQSGVYSSTAYQVAYARWEVLGAEIFELELKLKNTPYQERQPLLDLLTKYRAEMVKLEAILAAERAKWTTATSPSRILLNEFGYQMTDGFATRILYLSVDRWIGLEGLMAVQSYPDKSPGLMTRALLDKPRAGAPDVYQSISKSIYLKSDNSKFRFASLPGAAAFFYYSNSFVIVVLGMALFSVILLTAESAIRALTGNPILCSLYGAAMANIVTQFGVSPRQSLPYLAMLAGGIFLVWLVQSRTLNRISSRNALVGQTAKAHRIDQ